MGSWCCRNKTCKNAQAEVASEDLGINVIGNPGGTAGSKWIRRYKLVGDGEYC